MNRIISFLCIGFVLFIFGCGGTTEKKPVEIPETIKTNSIKMPSGLDTDILEKIKNNEDPKKRIAILEFEEEPQLKGKVSIKPSDMLTTALVRSGRFTVIEREKIDQIIKEQKLGLTGLVDPNTAAEVGKLLGAEAVIFGSITSLTEEKIDKFSYDIIRITSSVDIRMVESSTAKILYAETAQGVYDNKIVTTASGKIVSGSIDYNTAYAEALRTAADSAAEKIGGMFPLVGYVIQAEENEVYTDIGSERGAKKGNEFIVFALGKEITHPQTGDVLGFEKFPLARIQITSVDKKMSIGKILKKADQFVEIETGMYVISD